MGYRLFAMDTWFWQAPGWYPFAVRWEMLQTLGYDGGYHVLGPEAAWQEVPLLAQVPSRYGLEVAAVWFSLDLTWPRDSAPYQRRRHLVETLTGCSALEVAILASDPAIRPSDPALDGLAIERLAPLIERAAARGLTLSLYPHRGYWLERTDDALRLWQAIGQPTVGVVFSSYHWYAADRQDLAALLTRAAPALRSVNLCGCRTLRCGDRTLPLVEPLDQGDLDTFALLGLLRTIGYQGPIILQGYGLGGDIYAQLARARRTLREMEERLARFPHWGRLAPQGS